MIPDSHADIVGKKVFAHVATIGPDGEPQCTPVWVDGDQSTVRFSQTKGRQKYQNLQADDRIALSMIDPDNPYRYVEVRGRVTDITDDSDHTFINAMAKKYMGVDEYPMHQPGDERVVMNVTVEHTTQMG